MGSVDVVMTGGGSAVGVVRRGCCYVMRGGRVTATHGNAARMCSFSREHRSGE